MRSKAWYIVFCRPTPKTVVHEVYENKDQALKRFSGLSARANRESSVSLDQRWLTRKDIEDKRESGIKIMEGEQ